jgi:hypothetical protein
MAGIVGSLKVLLGLDAAEFVSGLSKAERESEKLVAATKRQSAAIDRQIKGFERQVAVLGMNSREQKLYELATKGATAAQLAQANAALRTVENFDRIKGAARSVGTALGALGVGSIAGIAALFNSVVKGIDDLNDLKDATGASIENLSALEDVGRRTGAGINVSGDAVIKLNKALNDTPDSDSARVLKSLGLDAEELKRIDPAEALRQVAVAFARFADDGNKGRAILELTGKSARDIAPFLKDLAEKGGLVAKVTTQQAEEAEKYRKAIFGLQADLIDVARSLAGPFVTALNDASAAMKRAREEGGGTFAAIVAGQKAILGIGQGEDRTAKLAELQKALAGHDAVLKAGNVSEDRRNASLARRVELIKQIDALAGGAAASFRPSQNYGDAFKPSLKVPDKPVKGKKEVDEVAKAMADLNEELALFGQSDIDKKLIKFSMLKGVSAKEINEYRAALENLNAIKVDEDITKTIDALLDEVRALSSSTEQLTLNKLARAGATPEQLAYTKSILDATKAARDEKAAQEEVKRLFEATRTPVEQYGAEIERLNKLKQQGRLDADLYARGIDQAVEALERATVATKEVAEETDTFTKRLQENVQDTLGSGLYDAMNGNFKNIGQSFVNMINRMVAEALAADLARKLFGEKQAGGAGSGGWIDSLFNIGMSLFGGSSGGSGGGGIMGGSVLPYELRGGRAGGGTVSGGMWEVAEKRPEMLDWNGRKFLMMGNQRGSIDPNPKLGGGRSVNQYNTFMVPGPIDRRSQAHILAAAGQGAQRALDRDA